MKFAAISDLHGNLPAHETVLADIAAPHAGREPDPERADVLRTGFVGRLEGATP